MIPLASHGGNVHAVAREQGRPLSQMLDFSASINPLGLSSSVREALQHNIAQSIYYPDPDGQPLRTYLAKTHRIPEGCLVLGNGSAELICLLPRALGCRHGLVIGPTFMEFERALRLAGAQCTYVHARSDENYKPPIEQVCRVLRQANGQSRIAKKVGTHRIDAVFLCHPNSPTGQVLTKRQFRQLRESVQKAGAQLVVDEAFVDYCPSRSVLKNIGKVEDLIVIRSFTKFYAIPGLRIGYLGGPENMVERLRSLLPPWSVNVLASAAAMAALQNTIYREESINFMAKERKRFRSMLRQVPGLRVFSSSTNFLLVELDSVVPVTDLCNALIRQGVLIRDCQDFAGISLSTIRLAVRRPKDNDRLVRALKRELVKCH